MVEYHPFADGVEVNGSILRGVVGSLGDVSPVFERKGHHILSECGVDDPRPDEWYPQTAWLSFFERIEQTAGLNTLRELGEATATTVSWPPEITTVTEALAGLDRQYQHNHRNGDIGEYRVVTQTADSSEVVAENPYPCVYDRGLILGIAEEFGGKNATLTETSDHCRSEGGRRCHYELEW
ncbi:MAG: hypothetical protein J07HB67_01961 [halophilic archaeon J07HB67]|nr:MAG: hypothetical protein J07HB67_01961 [halophilic archaeon J07HB67]